MHTRTDTDTDTGADTDAGADMDTAYALLMRHVASADDPATQALAGALGAAFGQHGRARLPLPGLDTRATRAVMARRFPGADAALGLDWAALEDAEREGNAQRAEPRRDEIDDLAALLRDHADPQTGNADDRDALAHALACASLGQNHLWQDLRLPSRRELSTLMNRWFPSLARRNDRDMKWKKFLYKQLCEREALFLCKAPSCGECADYEGCFGTEA